MRTRAGFSWALVYIGLISFVAIFVYSLLTPAAHWMLDFSLSQTTSTYSAEGISAVRDLWDYWPIWFPLVIIATAYIRAVRESKRGEV